jgi:hypothetical protein
MAGPSNRARDFNLSIPFALLTEPTCKSHFPPLIDVDHSKFNEELPGLLNELEDILHPRLITASTMFN